MKTRAKSLEQPPFGWQQPLFCAPPLLSISSTGDGILEISSPSVSSAARSGSLTAMIHNVLITLKDECLNLIQEDP